MFNSLTFVDEINKNIINLKKYFNLSSYKILEIKFLFLMSLINHSLKIISLIA